MLKRLAMAVCLSLGCSHSHASDWLLEAQLLASGGDDAAALALLWQQFPQHAKAEQAQGLLLAAELCARNGLIELARSYYLQRLDSAAESITSGDRYAIARFFADQQEWQRSIHSLQGYWADFPRTLKKQARVLLGLAQLKNRQPLHASQTLSFARHQVEPLPYRRYNLAVAEQQLGKTFEARQRLHKLLANNPHSLEQALLNDRIRVQLAQHYLSYQQGRFAAPLLHTIKYQSPYANQALLMLGWAALTPGGERPHCQQLNGAQACWIDIDQQGRDIQRSQTSISQTFSALRPTPPSAISQALQQRLQTAISSWQILAEKAPNSRSPIPAQLAQLEAKVALAYELQLRAQLAPALEHYQQALADIEAALANSNATADNIPYLDKLATLEAAFRQQPSLNPALKNKALTAISNARQYRQQQALLEQKQQRQQWRPILLEYKKQAHLGLASLHAQLSYQ